MSPRFSGWLGVVVWGWLAAAHAREVAGQTLCGFEPGFGGGVLLGTGSFPPSAAYSFDPDGDGPQGELLVLGSSDTPFPKVSGVPLIAPVFFDGQRWSSPAGAVAGHVWAIVYGDEDGSGPLPPALFVGGELSGAGGVPVSNIARWDGQAWSDVGGGVKAAGYAGVSSFCFFDPDEAGPQPARLFVGGVFDSAGGVPARNIAMWDGNAWQAIGDIDGPQAITGPMTPFDADGDGPDAPVLAITGNFTSAGGLAASSVAFWREGKWSVPGVELKTQSGGHPHILEAAVYDPDGPGPLTPQLAVLPLTGTLVAPGSNEVSLGRVALWDGTTWLPTAPAPKSSAGQMGMAVFDPDGEQPGPPVLAISGRFLTPASEVSTLAFWTEQGWELQGVAPTTQQYLTKTQRLFVSRVGRKPGAPPALLAFGTTTYAGEIARWEGDHWGILGNGVQYPPTAMTEFDRDGPGGEPSQLVTIGIFNVAGAAVVSGVAGWNGQSWLPLGQDLEGPPTALAAGPFDPASRNRLLACAFGSYYALVRAWDGASWTTLAPSPEARFYGAVESLVVFDEDGNGPKAPALYAGGAFTRIGGPTETTALRVARWDGVKWAQVGAGIGSAEAPPGQEYSVRRLVEFDPDGDGPALPLLAAGGAFDKAGSAIANGLAAWNGTEWLPVGPPDSKHAINALAVFDFDGPGGGAPALVAGGGIIPFSGGKMSRVGYWRNGEWVTMDTGLGSGSVRALATFDQDGAGPAPTELYIGGTFAPVGAAGSLGFARWSGDAWVAVGDTDTEGEPYVTCLAPVYGAADGVPALYLGGYFHSVHGVSSQYIAKWRCADAGASRGGN